MEFHIWKMRLIHKVLLDNFTSLFMQNGDHAWVKVAFTIRYVLTDLPKPRNAEPVGQADDFSVQGLVGIGWNIWRSGIQELKDMLKSFSRDRVIKMQAGFWLCFGLSFQVWWAIQIATIRIWALKVSTDNDTIFCVSFLSICLLSLLLQEQESALLSNLLSSASSPLFKKKSRNTAEPILRIILCASSGWLLEPNRSLMSEFPVPSLNIFFMSSVNVAGGILTCGIGSG